MRTSLLAVIPLAAVRTHALPLPIWDHWLAGHNSCMPCRIAWPSAMLIPKVSKANSALSLSTTLHRGSPPSWRHTTPTRNVRRASVPGSPRAAPDAGGLPPGGSALVPVAVFLQPAIDAGEAFLEDLAIAAPGNGVVLAAPPDGGALLSSRFLSGRALYASDRERICVRAVRSFRPRVFASG